MAELWGLEFMLLALAGLTFAVLVKEWFGVGFCGVCSGG